MKTHNKPVIMMDFGGVYFTEGAMLTRKKISSKYKLPESKVRRVLKGYHKRQERRRGKITRKQFWKVVSKGLNVPLKEMKEIEKIWHSSYKPKKGMPQLVGKLRRHYRVVSLTGNIPERIKYLENRYKMLKHFHDHHFSFDYGLTKDDGAKFFMAAVKKMKVKPTDCILVDDKKEFLAAVRKTGAKTILFKNAKQLERELRKLGVEI